MTDETQPGSNRKGQTQPASNVKDVCVSVGKLVLVLVWLLLLAAVAAGLWCLTGISVFPGCDNCFKWCLR